MDFVQEVAGITTFSAKSLEMCKSVKKKKKDSQLLIRINRQVRDRFVELCEDNNTDAAKQIRNFIEKYIERHEERSGD